MNQIDFDNNFKNDLVCGTQKAFSGLFDTNVKLCDVTVGVEMDPDIVSFIGMKRYGTEIVLGIEFSEEMINSLVKTCLPQLANSRNFSLVDVAGELTNCVCGLLKAHLSLRGMVFRMDVPMTIHHPYLMSFKNIQEKNIRYDFSSDHGHFCVSVFPVRNKQAQIQIR
jgi:hypothetical protein